MSICFFTTTKYGNDLINSNKKYFKYDLVWEKHIAIGFLNCNKMPLRSHEMIYIFNYGNIDDINIEFNLELREYAKKVLKFIDCSAVSRSSRRLSSCAVWVVAPHLTVCSHCTLWCTQQHFVRQLRRMPGPQLPE